MQRQCLLLVLMLLLNVGGGAFAQGLIVNEFSNGPASTQEYYELVVVGPDANPNCGPIDIRGWIVDDNNGDFACGPCGSVGIAAGHIRFGNLAVWSAIPTGSIIVLYDPTSRNPKVPADDPTDTSPTDGVYILPFNHATIDASVSPCAVNNIPFPNGACPGPCTGNATYAGSCYGAGAATTHAGLRNNGDAAQTRTPTGAYYHGIGYGTVASLVTGGPDGLLIAGDGTGKYYNFTNAIDNNYRNVLNWASAATTTNGESPGLANTVANQAWIATLGTPCPLPVVYASELSVRAEPSRNVLRWVTALEVNTSHFEILRSVSLAEEFEVLARVGAAGNSSSLQPYIYEDDRPAAADLYYQLRQVDNNGGAYMSEIVKVSNGFIPGRYVDLWPNPAKAVLHLHAELDGLNHIAVLDLAGRVLLQQPASDIEGVLDLELDLSGISAGTYILQLVGNQGVVTKRFTKQQ